MIDIQYITRVRSLKMIKILFYYIFDLFRIILFFWICLYFTSCAVHNYIITSCKSAYIVSIIQSMDLLYMYFVYRSTYKLKAKIFNNVDLLVLNITYTIRD